jgi:plastocyanin
MSVCHAAGRSGLAGHPQKWNLPMKHVPGARWRSRKLGVLGVGLAALILPLGLMSPAVAAPGPTTWTVLSGSESADMAIQGMAFLPGEIFIHPGDTVKWVANSAEIHTVTFLAAGQALQPYNPATDASPSGPGSSYDGTSYYNSGIFATHDPSLPTSYSLTFPTTGDFTYYCLVHGNMMKGIVHVTDPAIPYKFTQAEYDAQAATGAAAIIADGTALAATKALAANDHTVFEGADDGVAMVMRFIQPKVTVHVGETVKFINDGMGAPHTVTFGTPVGNPTAPAGDPTNFTGGYLNSGFAVPGTSFTVTFNKAGTFDYVCILHAGMGMVGSVTVLPAETPAAPATPVKANASFTG